MSWIVLLGSGPAVAKRLEINERIERAVRVEQVSPFVGRTPLRDHTTHRMALNTGVLDVRVSTPVMVSRAAGQAGHLGLAGGLLLLWCWGGGN